jgi:hypothetical protein
VKLDAAFEITGWEQDDYDAPAEGRPLTRATVRMRFTGALAGVRGDARMDHGRIALDYELG